MGSRNWTTEQQKVIDTRGKNILVSASAGSGKTAVLVERILQRILGNEKEEPIDIDRLLIVTFTNAAAAEMRERIGRLESERPGREKLYFVLSMTIGGFLVILFI